MSANLPTGTVTFLFTDIEGSTKLAQQYPDAMPALLARHHEILHHSIEAHNGYVFQVVGDSFAVAFHSATDALNAALATQRLLHNESWSPAPIKVRMGIHTGAAQLEDASKESRYSGYATLALTQRIMSAGHGGQILLSQTAHDLTRDKLPENAKLQDMGERHLKNVIRSEHIYQLTIPDLPSEFAPLNTLESFNHNLPAQLTSFIGREKEMDEIKKLVAANRIVTLTGSGGAGKTRLSLQVSVDCLPQFSDGVWFVELAPVADPALVPQIVATTLGLREQPGRAILDLLKDYLREKNVLLVLDNCEHLIDACTQLTDTLLHTATHLKILATSREALGIAGETTYTVPALSFPNRSLLPFGTKEERGIEALAQFEAVHLFIDRARAMQPTFAVTDANAAALAEICQRLDGIPLGLELAAARVNVLSVEQIAKRLDDRFRLLTVGSRTALPRQQTLRALIDWSYDLLSDQERVLLQRLSVFAGGFGLETAERVTSDPSANSRQAKWQVTSGESAIASSVTRHPSTLLSRGLSPESILDLLSHLVNKSLVIADEANGEARYRMLETIRQYAREKLGEAGQEMLISNRHLDYFLAFVEEIDQTLRGAEQDSGLSSLDRELDNLRAALAWSAKSNNVETELRLASALWRYWRVRSYFSEGRRWLEDALSRGEHASSSARAKALMGAGSLANYQADYARARLLLEESLALHRELNDKPRIANCLNLLSHGKMMTGDFAGAQASLEESFAIFRGLDDTRGMGYSLYFLGSMLLGSGDIAAARPVLEESLTRLKEAGDTWWVGNTLIQLGWGINRQGEHTRALQLFDEALEISAQFGDTRGTARALMYIAEAKFSQGEYEAARAKYIEGLKFFHEIGDKWWGTVCLEGLAYIAAHRNNARHAARLMGVAEHMHELLGAPILAVYRESHEWSADRARAQLGAQDFSEAWNEGRTLTYDQAIQLAMSDE